MKIHEYQAKNILRTYSIPVPEGEVAESPEKAREIATSFKGKTVIKAQIHAGGRGKGGGVRLAESPEEAFAAAQEIIGMNLVTHQTGPEGKAVTKVLVEPGLDIAKELYPDNYIFDELDISDATQPFEVGFWTTPGPTISVVVRGGYAYVAAGDGGLRVVDISDPATPREAGYYDTQGWAQEVTLAGDDIYLADDLGGLLILRFDESS